MGVATVVLGCCKCQMSLDGRVSIKKGIRSGWITAETLRQEGLACQSRGSGPTLVCYASITAQCLLFPVLAAVPCLVGGEEYEHLLSILSTRASSSSLNKAIWDLKVKIGRLYILQIVSEITSHLWLADPAQCQSRGGQGSVLTALQTETYPRLMYTQPPYFTEFCNVN